jgi:hypothetical protein
VQPGQHCRCGVAHGLPELLAQDRRAQADDGLGASLGVSIACAAAADVRSAAAVTTPSIAFSVSDMAASQIAAISRIEVAFVNADVLLAQHLAGFGWVPLAAGSTEARQRQASDLHASRTDYVWQTMSIDAECRDYMLAQRKARASTELAMEPTTLTPQKQELAMRNFILAAIAALSLSVGSAYAAQTVTNHLGQEIYGPAFNDNTTGG